MPIGQQSHQPLLKDETIGRRDSSSTEFDFHDGCPTPKTKPQRTLRSGFLRLLILGLVVFLSSALGYIAAWSIQKTVEGQVKSLKHHTTLTEVGELLYLPPEPRSFNPDEILGLPATVESNKAWMGLLGPSMGYVAIKDFDQYNIPAGMPYPPDNSTRVYGVAMFHQLHCLIMIRERYYNLLTGRKGPDDFKTDSSHELPKTLELNNGLIHLDHCFDYIQSGIRCAGQMDLQYPFKYGHVGFLSGEQQCRSWDAAVDIMEKLSFDTSAFTSL